MGGKTETLAGMYCPKCGAEMVDGYLVDRG